MGLKRKQTALLKETKDIESLDSCLPFLYLPPGQVHLFPATGSWTQSGRRGHRNTEPALMSLSLPVFPEPPHALGMLDKAHFTSIHKVPPHTLKMCQSSPPLPAQPALFPAHCSAPSFTQDRGISITQSLLQLHKSDDAGNLI